MCGETRAKKRKTRKQGSTRERSHSRTRNQSSTSRRTAVIYAPKLPSSNASTKLTLKESFRGAAAEYPEKNPRAKFQTVGASLLVVTQIRFTAEVKIALCARIAYLNTGKRPTSRAAARLIYSSDPELEDALAAIWGDEVTRDDEDDPGDWGSTRRAGLCSKTKLLG
ncbi:hypothetical protein FIBSPDRAFT_560765 [Athelia psychrophila]|uniref:Uncharacterized protein n=1 Tax=Athelia psychrophila TaxID=1759441 RepID=A0A167TCB5_9AGAM|nr:hypothetical protein FIBSPDRAFT_560765 [Fibularhizoctonia sp. CBS 109695]